LPPDEHRISPPRHEDTNGSDESGRLKAPPAATQPRVTIELEDGSRFAGAGFGHIGPASGEVVFNTSMVGYVESLTDPSYRGQILVLTYPLIGNYGVPAHDRDCFESSRIQASGLVVAFAHSDQSHATAGRSLHQWLAAENVPGVEGIDTRRLTILLRERGTMLGRILPAGLGHEPKTGTVPGESDEPLGLYPFSKMGTVPQEVQSPFSPMPMFDPNRVNIVPEVCVRKPERFGSGKKRVVLVDCGVKLSIRRELLKRGVEVLQVPHDYDYTGERFDGILVSNGPGNPEQCTAAVAILRRALALSRPVFGICLGCQLIALAAGARTYKLRYGHRGQNQPCREKGTDRCRLTSQNHGYAIDASSLPPDWRVWFENANDGSVEGIRHVRRPVSAVQFHPEGKPGPLDSEDLFDRFVESL
jgi:carbamoyl-phosphate synthase small subunit